MYVRLKHTLSALALEAVGHPERSLQKAALEAGLLERRGRTLVLPDGFRPHSSYLNRQMHRLERALRALTRGPRAGGRRATIQKGAALFNNGLFFECHELLEGAWRRARANDRTFYHGVILVAAAFYHHEKGNLHGARIKLTEGMKHLQRLRPTFHGVALARWLERLGPWKARLEAGQVPGVLRASEIPRIPLRARPPAPVRRRRGA